MQKRIFLSHSSRDKDSVRPLVEDLRRAGLSVWFDEDKIGVGQRISREIEKGLDSSDYIAIWLTQDAIKSGWVETEWHTLFPDEVASGRVTVFPLLAEDCDLPRFLRGKLYADFRRDYTEGLMDLLKALGQQTYENDLGMAFTLIMPGTFLMGSQEGEENEIPVHRVSISRPFYMGTYVVTQKQWKTVTDSEPWKGMPHVREGDNFPAVHVSWYDLRIARTEVSSAESKFHT
jgi:formylglycine-generating enzyme required for sulfatase activity